MGKQGQGRPTCTIWSVLNFKVKGLLFPACHPLEYPPSSFVAEELHTPSSKSLWQPHWNVNVSSLKEHSSHWPYELCKSHYLGWGRHPALLCSQGSGQNSSRHLQWWLAIWRYNSYSGCYPYSDHVPPLEAIERTAGHQLSLAVTTCSVAGKFPHYPKWITELSHPWYPHASLLVQQGVSARNCQLSGLLSRAHENCQWQLTHQLHLPHHWFYSSSSSRILFESHDSSTTQCWCRQDEPENFRDDDGQCSSIHQHWQDGTRSWSRPRWWWQYTSGVP